MITNYDKHWLRDVVYDLSKNHSTRVIWKRFVNSSSNYKTGSTDSLYQSARVKAILFPEKIGRVDRPTAQFPYGAVRTKGERLMILDQKHLPKAWLSEFQETDRVLIGERVFEIKEHDNFEGSSIWVLVVVNVKGTPNIGINVVEGSGSRALSVGQTATAEVA